MSAHVGVAPLTLVRTLGEDGAGMTVYVYAGRPVPDNADADDVKRLVKEGFLVKVKAKSKSQRSAPKEPESRADNADQGQGDDDDAEGDDVEVQGDDGESGD